MEINLENAFFNAVKLSIGPFASSFDVAALRVQAIIQQQTHSILEKPLRSTLIASCLLILLVFAVTISMIIIVGVLSIVLVILIVEGFVLGLIVGLAAAITTSAFGVLIILAGLVSSYKRKC